MPSAERCSRSTSGAQTCAAPARRAHRAASRAGRSWRLRRRHRTWTSSASRLGVEGLRAELGEQVLEVRPRHSEQFEPVGGHVCGTHSLSARGGVRRVEEEGDLLARGLRVGAWRETLRSMLSARSAPDRAARGLLPDRWRPWRLRRSTFSPSRTCTMIGPRVMSARDRHRTGARDRGVRALGLFAHKQQHARRDDVTVFRGLEARVAPDQIAGGAVSLTMDRVRSAAMRSFPHC